MANFTPIHWGGGGEQVLAMLKVGSTNCFEVGLTRNLVIHFFPTFWQYIAINQVLFTEYNYIIIGNRHQANNGVAIMIRSRILPTILNRYGR